MNRSTLRIVAVIVLALLGAPVGLHVVLHDLPGHSGAVVDHAAGFSGEDHGDHEHPIVASTTPVSPRSGRTALPALTADPRPVAVSLRGTTPRNVLSAGALRLDEDVGLYSLFSTFLI